MTTQDRLALAEAEVGLDVRQRDVHDGAVEHDHQLGAADDGERDTEAARAAPGLGFGEDVLGGDVGITDMGKLRGQGRVTVSVDGRGYAGVWA